MDNCPYCGTKLIETMRGKYCPNCGIVEEKKNEEDKKDEEERSYVG